MRDKTRGIYQKFEVIRADGSGAPGGKHENCFYFVLDCSHDPHAEAALKAYITSCRLEYPHLARDLECVLDECQFGRNTMVSSPVEPAEEHEDKADLLSMAALVARIGRDQAYSVPADLLKRASAVLVALAETRITRRHRGCGSDCTLPAGHLGDHLPPENGSEK